MTREGGDTRPATKAENPTRNRRPVRRLILRSIRRSRRWRDTRPQAFLEARLAGNNGGTLRAYRYARDLFEWRPFWPAILLNRGVRRPR